MKSVLIVDTETNGLEPATDRIIEVGAILYSLEYATPIASFSSLVNGEDNTASGINRIPPASLRLAPPLRHVISQVELLVKRGLYLGECAFMAHRAEFDQGFIEAADPGLVSRMPWVCSKFDVEWPMSKPGASCVEMALAHNVPVVSAHRALTDCMLIARTLENVQAMGHDVGAMITKALRPKVRVDAVTPKPWEVAEAEWAAFKAKLIGAGFRFDSVQKSWTKNMAPEDIARLEFEARVVA